MTPEDDDRIDIEKCWVQWMPIGYGMTLYVCWSPDYTSPVGFLWGFTATLTGLDGQEERMKFDVVGSYVIPAARRQGVRTHLNNVILQTHDIITTDNGSPEGGRAFMEAYGYRFKPEESSWVFVKPREDEDGGNAAG